MNHSEANTEEVNHFKYLIIIKPLGMMYGSAGAFLSPENLVGRSGSKFPPDAATLSGLLINAYIQNINTNQEINELEKIKKFKKNLNTAGPFWAEANREEEFYVPIPWYRIIGEEDTNEWRLDANNNWQFKRQLESKLEPAYTWQRISSWKNSTASIKRSQSCKKSPWKYISTLHTRMENESRNTLKENGLFLENAVQIPENICLVYLSNYKLSSGWYRFGGENHIVEIETKEIKREDVLGLLTEPIKNACAFITPGVWSSTRFSHRYPQHQDFPKPSHILTDKPIPYRNSLAGRLGRGRYAVPAGSVYVFNQPLEKSWYEWDKNWFPTEGYSLKQVGCGLCLPVEIEDLSTQQGAS